MIGQKGVGTRNLADFLPAGSAWNLLSGEAVNDNGTIVGWGYNTAISSTQPHAFRMTP